MSDLPPVKYLDMAAKAAGLRNWGETDRNVWGPSQLSIIAHARTLEALAQHEPEPVDADEAATVAILNAWYAEQSDASYYRGGNYHFDRALAQYKVERPSLSDDEALLIAREICARVAKYLYCSQSAIEIRNGRHDHCGAFQFALSMLKRDPAALEAFRGVGRG